MINKLKIELLILIKENSNISLEEICKLKKIKSRNLYNHVKDINDFLKINNFNIIENNNGKFSINLNLAKFNQLIQKKFYLFSQKERIDFICFDVVVFNKNKSLQNYSDFFMVSKSTIISDFNLLKKKLEINNLQLIFNNKTGYKIIGDQLIVRNLIINYINTYTINDNYLFLREMFDIGFWENKIILKLILEFENFLNTKFTSSYFLFLKRYLSILHTYYLQNNFIEISDEDKQFIQNTKELDFASKIIKVLTPNYNNDEVYYIAILLLAGNVITNYSKNISLINLCKEGLVKMLNSIEQNHYLFFHNKDQLIDSIINHLVPAYYRVKFNLKVDYEYIHSVKSKYKEFYLITKTNIKHLEKILKVHFNDDEILLISLYVVSNLLTNIDSIKRIKTIIVSTEGLNISHILKLEIEKTFLNLDVVDILYFDEIDSYDKHYDLILSFYDLKKPNYIKIKNILTNSDKKKINEWVANFLLKENRESLKIKNVLKKNYIQILNGDYDWKTSIQISAQPLIDNSIIFQSYVNAMIENIVKYKACIILRNDIAMPHASFQDGVQELGFSFNVLKKPVIFPGKNPYKIKIIIILAPVNNDKHIRPMLELVECLKNEKKINEILKAQTSKQIYEIISKVT